MSWRASPSFLPSFRQSRFHFAAPHVVAATPPPSISLLPPSLSPIACRPLSLSLSPSIFLHRRREGGTNERPGRKHVQRAWQPPSRPRKAVLCCAPLFSLSDVQIPLEMHLTFYFALQSACRLIMTFKSIRQEKRRRQGLVSFYAGANFVISFSLVPAGSL